MQVSNGPSALFLLAGMPEHQGTLRAGFGRIPAFFRDVFDSQPGQHGRKDDVPDEDDQCHFGPR